MLLILTFLYFLQAYLRTLEKQIGIKAILTLSFKPESLEKKKNVHQVFSVTCVISSMYTVCLGH